MPKRDEFDGPTKRKLADFAGHRCSRPDCGVPTTGAGSDGDSVINLGVAAHITAAAPGGPRYNKSLTSAQRKHHSNGIWLCQTDAKLVDSDKTFTSEELHRWKREANKRSFDDVVNKRLLKPEPNQSDAADSKATVTAALPLAREDMERFKSWALWPEHTVSLGLVNDENRGRHFDVAGLVAAISTFDELLLIAPPGTGKTTTLLQFADRLLADAVSVAVFVPLSDWATRRDHLFQSIASRRAFREFGVEGLEGLAEHGKLTLLLDGWNELDAISRDVARAEVTSIQRDFPEVKIVISSRERDLDSPLAGQVVRIAPLTHEQQVQIAKAMRGDEGEKLMEHAWRTPGLRELVTIPLYLSVLLQQATGSTLPTTREEVLRVFVREHEQDADKFALIRRELHERHTVFLTALSSEMLKEQTTSLPDEAARRIVGDTTDQLLASHQIGQPTPAPLRVLDILVGIHLLTRSGGGSLSFQHQQFQEWFGSLRVEELMKSALTDARAAKTLREEILNWPIWEESILFASERMSYGNPLSIEAVGATIVHAFGIDPMLAAEMIYRASDEVWLSVKDAIVALVRRWHTLGQTDRAFKFMVQTGKPDFAEYVWPIVLDPDDQVHL